MKTLLKSITGFFTGALTLASAYGQGVEIRTFTVALPTTFSIAAATTNTALASSNIVITVTRGGSVGLQMSHPLQGSGTSAVVWKFDESVDGIRWERNVHSITVTATGTNEVTTAATVTLGGMSYLRLSSCENPNSAAVTNIVGVSGVKTGI